MTTSNHVSTGRQVQLSAQDRQQLIREGLPIVDIVARRLSRRFAIKGSFDDFRAIGREALLSIAQIFDPVRGDFESFAATKIKWAILDYLRKQHHTRSISSNRVVALSASEQLLDGASLDDAPLEDSIDAYRKCFQRLLQDQATAIAMGLMTGHWQAPDELSSSPEHTFEQEQLAESIRQLVLTLPGKQRLIIERHYFDGERFEAIAQALGISKSWTSRLHAAAIRQLSENLRRTLE